MKKPIAFYDVETTGTDVTTARICQIAIFKVDGKRIEKKQMLINPTVPIPAECTEVHGITDEMVKDARTFKQISKSLFEFMQGCDLGGHNIVGYDVPVLAEEFARASIKWPAPETFFVDTLLIMRKLQPNTLSGAVKFYLNKDHTDAHDAAADIQATIDVYEAQLTRYDELKGFDAKALHEFCEGDEKRVDLAGKLVLNKEGKIVYAFGKDKGKCVKENPGFGQWMLGQSFPTETKEILKALLYGKK